MKIAAAFSAIVDYGLSIGVSNLEDRPGLWEVQIDEHWFIALNPHEKTLESSHGPKVKFGQCYVEFNGWPAGILYPEGGIIAAGAIANEQTLIAALKEAMQKAKQVSVVGTRASS